MESVPEPVNLQTEGNLCAFIYNIGKAENKIQINGTLKFNSANVGKEFYPVLKDFYKRLVDKQAEKIILKKIAP